MVGVQQIVVKQTGPETFEVSVSGSPATTHRVTAPAPYVRSLIGGRAQAADLVRKSFEFLLEREPNTSILRTFELRVIRQYFPEYEQFVAATFGE